MNPNLPIVVIVDDEVEILNSLKRVIRKFDCDLHLFDQPKEALAFIKDNEIAVICSDQRMPKVSGIELLKETMSLWPKSQRIMLSAYQDFDNISQGFNDGTIQRFIAKPWNNKELTIVFSQLLSEINKTKAKFFGGMIGKSKPMLKLFELTKAAAGANVPIFVHGETGTGKELVANACHSYSYRAENPFIPINCANLSENLIESQLFGHQKGAFTGATRDQQGYFERSQNGTIFLDEITTLPLELQAKLLRTIQEREFTPLGSNESKKFDAQIISASSTSLSKAVELGEFREDLYYRLAVIQLKIPRLSDRDNDVILIAQHFINKFSLEQNKGFRGFSDDAIEYVKQFSWPGNIRQLENLLHGVIILNTGTTITKKMLLANMDALSSTTETNGFKDILDGDIKPLATIEKESILLAIEKCDGNILQASKLLEVNPSTIYRKMSKW
jgi:two-component system repressor protein LuxO